MARFMVAEDLSSWRERRRKRRGKRRAPARPAGRARGGGSGAGRITLAPAPASAPAMEEAIPLREAKRGRGRRGRGRGRDALRGEEDLGYEAELEAELDDGALDGAERETEDLDETEDLGDEDLGAERGRRRLGARVRDAVTRDWQRPIALGERMRLQTRPGTRAAVVEVKPGLFVVAEVPAESVEFGFGPMLLAPALIKTLGRALQGRRSAGGAGRAHRPELSTPAPKQLPGPTADEPETSGLAPWLDGDIAAELGCPCELPAKRRRP